MIDSPVTLLTLVGDASDWNAVSSAVDTTVAQFGRLDAVVANAGFALLIRAALPALTRTRGRTVLIGSVAGVVYSPGNWPSAVARYS